MSRNPKSTTTTAVLTLTEAELYRIATRILEHDNTLTSQEVKEVSDAKLIAWEVDCDGYAPFPTDAYFEIERKLEEAEVEYELPGEKKVSLTQETVDDLIWVIREADADLQGIEMRGNKTPSKTDLYTAKETRLLLSKVYRALTGEDI